MPEYDKRQASPDQVQRHLLSVKCTSGLSNAVPEKAQIFDVVEEAGLESFPASDPPSWTP